MSPGILLQKQQSSNTSSEEDQDIEEPIAVCGLSLKFPQDAVSAETFWKLLAEKRSARTEYPEERLNIDSFHHPNRRNALCTRGGHFIKEDLSLFDADFFSITPSEAAAMDPNQRLLLETTFRALENAGIRLEDIKGSRTSVHTGCFSNDYLQQLLKDAERLPQYAAVGASQSMLANRLSWFFDLRGPSVNLDSACSSSAMAVDLACQLLRSGQTDMGLAAGCNLTLDPDYSTILSNMQMLSPDGRCHTFDHRANGYSRGEGVGVVVLKRLSDALRDNDTIRAVIRASGSNQDGRTPGITQPDGKAQAQLIRETYHRAGLSMSHTRFFEAHGTGTSIGDPIEVGAIADCFRNYRSVLDPLYVGAVKTNIGHLEGASGIAGLIKAILVVESGVIPPNTNFEQINRKLASYDSCIALPSRCVAWPGDEIRRVSINSFGYGGANCHIVIDDAYSYLTRNGLRGNHRTAIDVDPRALENSFHVAGHFPTRSRRFEPPCSSLEIPKLLVWSGSSETATAHMISKWEKYCANKLQGPNDSWVSDVAYTLDSRRSTLSWKSYALVSSLADTTKLTQLASAPKANKGGIPRLAFIFTGQGSQWYAMGRELFKYPAFMRVLDEAEALYKRLGCPWSVKDELKKTERESNIDHPYLSQPLTGVVQIGLVDLLKSFDISPVAVVGHSMGEIAAAYCAGFITRESAFRLVYYRGLYVSMIPEKDPVKGAMLAVSLSSEKIQPYFHKLRACSSNFNLVISCVNSPVNVTVAGEESQIENLREMLQEDSVFARRLRVAVAYHSPQMEQITEDCLQSFGTLECADPSSNIKMISSVTGSLLSQKHARDPRYWVDNMVSPVLFSQAIERLCQDSVSSLRKKLDGSHRRAIVVDHLVEIGPHAALRLPIQDILATLPRKQEISYMSALYRKRSASDTLLDLVGTLHCSGLPVNLRQVNDPGMKSIGTRISLADAPDYPFEHSTKYWSESPLSRNYRLRPYGHVELLGSPSRDWNPLEPQWRCVVQVSEMPWLLDHKLNGRAIYPAAALVVMAVEGVSQLVKKERAVTGFTLRKVQFHSAISVAADDTDVETRLRVSPVRAGPGVEQTRWTFSVYSVSAGNWSENCHGAIEVHYSSEDSEKEAAKRVSYYRDCWDTRTEACTHTVESSDVYNNFKQHGFQYGPSLQGITTTRHDGTDRAMTNLSLENPLHLSPVNKEFVIHPASLDSFMQLALVALNRGGTRDMPTQAISAIEKLWISNEGLCPSNSHIAASAKLEDETPRNKCYSAFALSEDKRHLRLALDGLETTVVATSSQNTEKAPGENQFWYNIGTTVDVDHLSANKTLELLEAECGADVEGPKEFSLDLRAYIYSKVKDIRESIRTTGITAGKPHLLKYVDWMDWHLEKFPDTPSFDRVDEALRTRIADQGILGNFFIEVADNALSVLQGETDIIQLLFETNLVESFYEQQSFGSIYYEKLEKYVEGLSSKYPNMDILEVGAGTGSFTEHILNGLCSKGAAAAERFNNYCFTDVSPAFYERARERFSHHAHKMSFNVLDAEKDPLTQGFKEGTFDIVSASNVLHVTKDLGKTLRNLRKLLKPGGKLLLHEIMRPESIAMGFVFGLLPGWWPGAEDDRPMAPVVTEARWDSVMRSNGFSGADMILRDYADDDAHLMSIICATAVASDEQVIDRADVTVVIEAESSLQRDLANKLIAQLSEEGFSNPDIATLSQFSGMTSPRLMISLFDVETAILSRANPETFQNLKAFLSSTDNILWVSNGGGKIADPNFGMIDGFAKVFRIENPTSKFSTLALENVGNSQTSGAETIVSALKQFLKSRERGPLEDYRVINGVLNISRIHENTDFKAKMMESLSGERVVTKSLQDAKPFTVDFKDPNRLDTLKIRKDTALSPDLSADEVEIEVHAVGFNGIDSSLILGKTSNLNLARECSGVVTKAGNSSSFLPGDRVCAYGTSMLNSTIRTRQKLVARIPEWLSFADAATIPQDHLFATYLADKSIRIREDDVVLIHGGHTRIAMALICHIQKTCSKLFVTVPTQRDEEVLKTAFGPVMTSTFDSFTEEFRCAFSTGADIVLDFTDSDILQLSECASTFGQVVSVKSAGKATSGQAGSFNLPPNISFKTVDEADVLRLQEEHLKMPSPIIGDRSMLNADCCFSQLHSFNLSDIESAIARLRELKGEDRVAIEFMDHDQITVTEHVESAYSFDPLSSYVIAGGLGDLGRCVATWMVKRGARNLILLSRSGPRTDAAKEMIKELEECGAKVFTPLCNVTDRSSLEKVLHQCSTEMPPIKGCIQTSAALKDIMYENMSFEDWKVAVDPKVKGSWNLHELLPTGMDFFILTSSITGIMGQATQINYAAGNTYQDALAKYRISVGEKAVSLDLGILLTGGLLSQSKDLVDRLVARNLYSPIPESEILALFDYFCNPSLDLAELPAQVVTGIVRPSLNDSKAADFPAAFHQPFWSQTLSATAQTIETEQSTEEETNVRSALAQASSLAEAGDIVTNALAEQFCRMLLISKSKLNVEEPLHAAGADSLSAVDLRNWIMKKFAVDMPVFDILGDMSVIALGNVIAKEWMAAQGK